MKCNIYQTVQVSDEQRKAIAATIDDAGTKPRQATRDEIKEYVWEHGRHWADRLDGSGEPDTDADEPAPDAIHGDDELADLI